MHMLLILLTLCLRKPDGISHLFSMAYAFAGNGCSWGERSAVRGVAQALPPEFSTLHGWRQGSPHQPRILGSRISRKASPSRFTASTVREMARPGNTTSHHRGL